MTPEQFVYWLKGFHVGTPASTSFAPTEQQWLTIVEYLKLVDTSPKIVPPTYSTGTPPHIDHTKITC